VSALYKNRPALRVKNKEKKDMCKSIRLLIMAAMLIAAGCGVPETVVTDTPECDVPEAISESAVTPPADRTLVTVGPSSAPVPVQPAPRFSCDDFQPTTQWQEVTECKKLSNGHFWLVTREIIGPDNPCLLNKNFCPVRGFVAKSPANRTLVREVNSYLAKVTVTAEERDSNLYVSWIQDYGRHGERAFSDEIALD
jgi:hypothetical protein